MYCLTAFGAYVYLVPTGKSIVIAIFGNAFMAYALTVLQMESNMPKAF